MANFTVTFQLQSFYPDDEYDLKELFNKDYEADDLDSLFDILDDTDELDSVDDTGVLNDDSPDEPDEINIEYVLIHDQDGNEVYRDEDYGT